MSLTHNMSSVSIIVSLRVGIMVKGGGWNEGVEEGGEREWEEKVKLVGERERKLRKWGRWEGRVKDRRD